MFFFELIKVQKDLIGNFLKEEDKSIKKKVLVLLNNCPPPYNSNSTIFKI